MDVIFKYTLSEYLDQLPVVNGQLIIITDKDEMYYDIANKRHSVEPRNISKLVTTDTEQTVSGNKTFTGAVQIDTLTQGETCNVSDDSFAHAEGHTTLASGKYSHAQGESTESRGIASAASGKASIASGQYSEAHGVKTEAYGEGSFTAGAATQTTVDYSAAFGLGNDSNADDLFEIGNGTVLDSNGEILPEESIVRSNAFRVKRDGTAVAQKDVETASGIKLSNREAISNKVTNITASATDTQYPSALAVKKLVDSLPEPMIFKGTLGTGGTITSLPAASTSNTGFTYKVITAGTYASQQAKVGDTLISTGTKWEIIPSGDEPAGTVTNVAATGSNGISVSGSPITSSGTLTISGVNATQSANGMLSAADKKKLDGIAAGANAYTLPTASASTKGGIKVGTNLTMDGDVLNAKDTTYSPATTSTDGLLSSSDKQKLDGIATGAQVNVIETVKVNGTALTPSSKAVDITVPSVGNGTITIKQAGTTKGTFTTNQSGDTTIELTDNNTTYSNFVKSGTGAKAGLVPAPSTTAGTAKYLREDGTWTVPPDTNTTYSDMTGATSSKAGTHGLVPAPASGKQASFLRGDGTWAVPTDTDTHYTTGLKVGASATATANAAATNGNVYMNVLDNTTVRDSHKIVGSGATTVTSDANGVITISSTDRNTDTKATQTNTTTSADYRVALSYNANDTTETQSIRKSGNFLANPSTGEFYAKGYRRIDITGQTLDVNTLNLSSGSPMIMRYIEKTSSGAAGISNIPVTTSAFILDVELIRWASTTDYMTKQTFVSVDAGAKAYEYVRYCTSGTWDSAWTKRIFTDTDTWRGIQNNLTSDSTTDSLSAAQGKVLKGLVDGKAASDHIQAYSASECITYSGDDKKMGVTPAAVKKAITQVFDPKPHTHDYLPTTNPVGTGSLSLNRKANTAVGDYSSATGYNTTASGLCTHAEGNSTSAYSANSHAEGYSTTASNSYAHAEGNGTTASGQASHAEGELTQATGHKSHAEGDQTVASGVVAHTEGWKSVASGDGSHAEGSSTTASGTGAHSEGCNTIASGEYSHAEGYSDSPTHCDTSIHVKVLSESDRNAIKARTGIEFKYLETEDAFDDRIAGYEIYSDSNYQNKVGTITCTLYEAGGDYFNIDTNTALTDDAIYYARRYGQASGTGAHSEGCNTIASWQYSHAEGGYSTASGLYSHSEGQSTSVGEYSHSEGLTTIAKGSSSHAEGENTIAAAENSHSEGYYTVAAAFCSHAEGNDTIAGNHASHAGGHLNAAMTTGGATNNTVGTAFVIGNGTSDSARSNAFSVQFNGVVKAKSTITASTTADYAEFFEWIDGNPDNEDRVGYFVTLDGNKIRIATESDDYILGVVSGEPFVLGNGDCDTWNKMFLHDEFRRTIYEPAPKLEKIEITETRQEQYVDVESGEKKTRDVEVVIGTEYREVEGEYEGTRPVLNPEYDATKQYVSRFDRKEWSPIGMLGVLAVRHDGTAQVNGYVTINQDGIATACERQHDNSYRVIKSNSESVVEIIFR